MKTRLVGGTEVHQGSDNVFADLGLVDAEKLKIKTGLVIEIRKAMKSRGLTQLQAAKLMGVTQPKVSDMMRSDFSNLSERKLMDCLTRLGYGHWLYRKRDTKSVTLEGSSMAYSSRLHVRVDDEIKAQASEVLASMGLSVSDAVRILLKRVVNDQAFPLELKVPNAQTRAAMDDADALMKARAAPRSSIKRSDSEQV